MSTISPVPFPIASDDHRNEWDRWFAWWSAAHAGLVAFGFVLTLFREDATAPRIAASVVLGLASIGLMLRICAPALRCADPADAHAAARYLVPAVVVFGAMTLLSPSFFFLLYILYPCVFALARTLRSAVGWALLVSGVASATIAYWDDWQPGNAALQGGGSFVFAILTGLWITRIIAQSRERADLIAALGSTQAELAAAQHAAGVREERQRVAGEIHDTVAQGLASIVMLAQGASSAAVRSGSEASLRVQDLLETIERTARDNLLETRALVEAMRPPGLGPGSFADAIGRLADHHERVVGGVVTVAIEPTVGLAASEEVVLFRSVQEALTNVGKHADADRVLIELAVEGDRHVLRVSDNGSGHGPATPGSRAGQGLSVMRDRVERIGGSLSFTSGTCGAVLVVEVPRPAPIRTGAP